MQREMFNKGRRFDRNRVHQSTSPNGLVHTFADVNNGRVAEVLDCAGTWNVRIDSGGKPERYIAGVKTATPEAAYEYALEYAPLVVED